MGTPTKVDIEEDLVAGVISKVTCQSGIPMYSRGFNGPIIPNPYPEGDLPPAKVNWERQADGSPPAKEKSYPATYTIHGGGCQKDMEVDVEILELEGKHVGKSAELIGDYLGIPIKAKAPITLKKGPITKIACSFVALPNKLMYVPSAGITWFLKVDGLKNPVCIGETKFEIFFIYAKPKKPWAGKKVWYEAVRFAFTDLDVGNRCFPLSIMKRVTIGLHYCGIHYDTVGGANRYEWHPNGSKNLFLSGFIWDAMHNPWAYPEAVRPRVNCYDMAALFIIFGTLLGVPGCRSYYLGTPGGSPVFHGFIKTTFLVGVTTLCNNPFYSDPRNNPNPYAPEDDLRRSGFGNHAFGFCGATVFDACAGPFKGDGGVAKYVCDTVDARRNRRDSPSWTYEALLAGAARPRDVDSFS